MVDWQDPLVQEECVYLFTKMLVFALGAFGWYLLQTWPTVEGALVTRRLKLAYPHVPYLFARYSMFATLIMSTIMAHMSAPLATSCENLNLTRADFITGNLTLVASSTNLGVRAFALWRENSIVRVILTCCSTGHAIYAILIGLVAIRVEWDQGHTHCVLINTITQRSLMGYYVYTVSVDIIMLALTLLGLRKHNVPSNSPMWTILTKQGVGYVVLTCLTCVPVAIVLLLDLNETMNIFLAIPASAVSTIASSAAVMSLLEMRSERCSRKNPALDGRGVADDEKANDGSFNQLTTNINLADFRDSGEISRDNDIPEKLMGAPSYSVSDIEQGP